MRLTFGERGGRLGVESEDEVEQGHEDAAAAYATDGAKRGAEEADDGGHHQPPVELEILKLANRYKREEVSRETKSERARGVTTDKAEEQTAYGPDGRRARGQAESGWLGGGDDETGEDGCTGGAGGDVGEESSRAGPVEAAV